MDSRIRIRPATPCRVADISRKFLKTAIRNHCNYALIEVTSQAVVQHRHRFINWNMGVLTNLAPEHIESHGSFENYREAKDGFS